MADDLPGNSSTSCDDTADDRPVTRFPARMEHRLAGETAATRASEDSG